MAQADLVVANQSGSAFRADLNNQLMALGTLMSGSSAPSSTYSYMLWVDTANNLIKLRNSANNAWINLFTTGGGVNVGAASTFGEDVTFTDNNKAIFGSSSDLTVHHDSTGSNNYIESAAGQSLILRCAQFQIQGAGGGETLAVFNDDGNVNLYHDNVSRFNTTSTGAHCSGKLVASGDGAGEAYSSPVAFLAYSSNSNDATTAEIFQGRYNKRALTISHANTGSTSMIGFEQSDSNVGSISGNGSNVAYNTSSDYRLKENEVLISDGIERLKTLKPYRFNFKTTPSKTVDGFFAHEVTAVPEAIHGEKDAVEEDGSIKSQQLDYSKLTPLLTAALQEAIGKIENLETKVAALEAK